MPFRSWYVSAQEALEEKKHVEWQFCGHSHDFHVMFSCQRGLCGSDIIHSLRLELLHAFVEPCDFLSDGVIQRLDRGKCGSPNTRTSSS